MNPFKIASVFALIASGVFEIVGGLADMKSDNIEMKKEVKEEVTRQMDEFIN